MDNSLPDFSQELFRKLQKLKCGDLCLNTSSISDPSSSSSDLRSSTQSLYYSPSNRSSRSNTNACATTPREPFVRSNAPSPEPYQLPPNTQFPSEHEERNTLIPSDSDNARANPETGHTDPTIQSTYHTPDSPHHTGTSGRAAAEVGHRQTHAAMRAT